MRLINTKTKQLKEFLGKEIPQYAILSHTWGIDDEILFEDVSASLANARKKGGYPKFESACSIALSHGCSYLWMDTCCIDKSSSSELSEAINSMFRWYKRAKICIAYLEDVGYDHTTETDREKAFAGSRWFTRGWTLQELIAPSGILFYSKEWKLLGKRHDLAGTISAATGIDPYILTTGRKAMRRTSMAERMSWAAERKTTRPEDIAYCLLGIFDVNMNLLYGEGKTKAFTRLQIEILKRYPDQSLLAWTPKKAHKYGKRGPLALHPKEFADAAKLIPSPFRYHDFSMTEMGLQMTINVFADNEVGNAWGLLECQEKGNFRALIAVPLRLMKSTHDKYLHMSDVRLYARDPQQPPTLVPVAVQGFGVMPVNSIPLWRGPPDHGLATSTEQAWKVSQRQIFIPMSPKDVTPICEHVEIRLGPDLELMTGFPQASWNPDTRVMNFDRTRLTEKIGAIFFKSANHHWTMAVIFGLADENCAFVKLDALVPEKVHTYKDLEARSLRETDELRRGQSRHDTHLHIPYGHGGGGYTLTATIELRNFMGRPYYRVRVVTPSSYDNPVVPPRTLTRKMSVHSSSSSEEDLPTATH